MDKSVREKVIVQVSNYDSLFYWDDGSRDKKGNGDREERDGQREKGKRKSGGRSCWSFHSKEFIIRCSLAIKRKKRAERQGGKGK